MTLVGDVDCVLLDLGLPDAQGLDGLRRLTGAAGRAAICVLTGLGDDHIGAAAVAEGAQDYLIKGQVDGTLLARSVRYAVERKRADENARRLQQVELHAAGVGPAGAGPAAAAAASAPSGSRSSRSTGPAGGRELGGDFYDVVQTRPDRLAMMVGDVCGHGVDEAALGVELRVAWRALTLGRVDDDAVLPAIEQVLISERNRAEVFATLAMVTIDLDMRPGRPYGWPGTRRRCCSRGGDVSAVPAVFGPVLGVLDDAERPPTEFELDGAGLDVAAVHRRAHRGPHQRRRPAASACPGCGSLIKEATRLGVARSELAAWLAARVEEANGGPLADDVAMLLLSPAGGGP